MEVEAVDSLAPLIQAADEWREVLLLLPLLVALEAVLSADNAIALAAISRRLHDPARQRQALNLGLALALVFRLLLVLAAGWVLRFWPLQLAASAYLLWLCGSQLLQRSESEPSAETSTEASAVASATMSPEDGSGAVGRSTPAGASEAVAATGAPEPEAAATSNTPRTGLQANLKALLPIVATLAFTDLAFSLDSVAAAVAVSDRIALVMAGGVIGVIALRLTAGLFIRWLEIFSRLETAGYLAVGLVGVKLLLRVLLPDLELPEWALLAVVAVLFAWGFSQRQPEAEPEPPASLPVD